MYKKFLMICIASCFASHAASLDLSQATQETLDTLCAIMEDSGNTNEILTQINTYLEFVHSFINHGGDINAPIYPKDQTALMMAAQYQQSSLVKILVTAGANPSMKDSLGFSALTYALVAAYSQNPTLKNACLIAAGYDPNNHKKTVHYLLTSVAKENQEAF
ncbi:MAG: ankyrin repeat domain-containing protein, partial [Candidatus Babeliales bacterium]